MPGIRESLIGRRFFSLTICNLLVLNTLIIGISLEVPNVYADSQTLSAGNLRINMLTDFGRIFLPLQWPGGGTFHTVSNGGFGYMGLVVDQQNYDHTPGSMDIADCYTLAASNYMSVDDFTTIKPIELIINTPEMDKMIGSFQNTGTIQDPNDILINLTAWSVQNKDWAILQWHVNNIKSPSADILNFKIGFEADISQEGASYGLGGDSGDDIDGFDAAEDVYWAQDNSGAGVCLGFASVIVTDPINHYYSQDYHPPTYDDYKTMWEDEDWLYDRISAPNTVEGANPGNRTSTVGWNGFTIPAGGTRTFTMVIAMNNTYSGMITAIKDAQWYYKNVLTGFLITEFSDSEGSHQIEVYNNGREPTDVSSLSLSLDGGITFLTGNWNPTIFQTYEHSIFSITGGTIGNEGDTIGLYEYGDLIDQIAFGQEGVAPDPLSSESTSRYWDNSTMSYTDDWTREVTPTFGAQNDVLPINSSSFVILNEVMFNPYEDPGGKYFVIINRQPGCTVNISNYIVVSDAEYVLPNFSNTTGGFNGTLYPPGYPQNSVKFKFMDDSPNSDPFFQTMNDNAPLGDNVYFYDPNGRLLDMVGWNTQHTQGMSVRRVPDGNGTHKGHNDITSIAAGWVFDYPPHVIITEFSDDEGTSQIEVYNPSNPLIDFSVGYTFENSADAPLTGAWSIPTVSAGEYGVFEVTSGNLNPEGDSIHFYHNGVLIDRISYGQKGNVPDPLAGESVQRYWDRNSMEYTNVWERNWFTGPNFGGQNDIPPANFSSLILLNEIMSNPHTPSDYFIEIYLLHGSLNISGYRIVCDSVYIIPNGIILTSTNPLFYLNYAMDPSFFNNMDPSGDNVYLYDDNGSLLDMAGWSSLHKQGESMRRVPDGNGTRDGFDDASSIAAGWVFGNETEPPPPPSPPRSLIAVLINDAEDVVLTWNASSDDGAGDNDIAGYSVYKSSTGINGNYDFVAWIVANCSTSYNWIDIGAGDGDWNNYFYIVRANDTLDHEEQNTNKAGKFTNYLVKNWNLISVPLIQANMSMDFVLQTIKDNYTIVQGYHAGKSRPWLHHHKKKPKYFNDEIEINHKEGYYIKMTNPDYLIVAGRVPVDTHISLTTGWNLVGYPCLVNKTRDHALSSISGKYNMVEYYDTKKGREVRLGPDDFMQPGLGYWIHATEDCVLIL